MNTAMQTLNFLILLFTTIASFASAVVGFVVLKRQIEMHMMMNSRLDQLIIETKLASHAAGESAGRAAAANERHAETAQAERKLVAEIASKVAESQLEATKAI